MHALAEQIVELIIFTSPKQVLLDSNVAIKLIKKYKIPCESINVTHFYSIVNDSSHVLTVT